MGVEGVNKNTLIAGSERVILSSKASTYMQASTRMHKYKYTQSKGLFVLTVMAKRRVTEEGE